MVALASGLTAQERGALRIDGAAGTLATDLAECRRRLSAVGATAGEQRAMTVLGQLRLAQLDTARDLLDASPPDRDVAAACWAVVSHHWYLRASADTPFVRDRLPTLRNALAAATPAGPAATATFAEAALVPHAWLCLGDLLTACGDGDGTQAAATSRRAIELWLDLERQVWQPGRGHFRPRPTRGRILLPEPPDATVLAPAAAGLLLASGDHLQRHLHASLSDLLRRPAADACAAAWLLAGAAQLGDRDLLDAAWDRLSAFADRVGATSGGEAGRRLDAMVFAITGLRLATGAGVDARCVRLRPHLPPGHDHLTLRGLVADGAHFDLDLAARSGARRDDEPDEATALGARPGPRLRVTITLGRTRDGSARSFVLQGDGLQYVARLQAGDQLARSLPIARR